MPISRAWINSSSSIHCPRHSQLGLVIDTSLTLPSSVWGSSVLKADSFSVGLTVDELDASITLCFGVDRQTQELPPTKKVR